MSDGAAAARDRRGPLPTHARHGQGRGLDDATLVGYLAALAPADSLSLIGAATVVLGYFAAQIRVDSSVENLLPR